MNSANTTGNSGICVTCISIAIKCYIYEFVVVNSVSEVSRNLKYKLAASVAGNVHDLQHSIYHKLY